MTVRTILHFPDDRLRVKAEPVTDFGPDLQQLVDDMAETMYDGRGIGLAAPQVGEGKRLFIIDIANNDEEAPSELMVFVNPVIVETAGEVLWNEGCLSFPGIREDIERAERVRVRAQNGSGKPFELEAEELLAVAIQHETDHLDGVLIIDHLSLLRKRLVKRAMSKREVDATV
jgi:peptide deformylase